MNKILNLLAITVLFSQFSFAQSYDLGKKPEPLGTTNFEFPEYTIKTLDNGLKVIFIEDHEQPVLSFNILLPGGDALEVKQDAAGFAAALIMKGTKTKSAYEISNTLDGIGADLSVSNSTEYTSVSGSTIMKHKEVLLNMLVDVLTNPTFPAEELAKFKVIAKTAVKSSKSDPGTLASNMAKIALFGKDHPYSKVTTEKSIDAVTIDDVKKYYHDFYIPNSASMVVVGDFDTDDMFSELQEKLAPWKKGKGVNMTIPEPKPMPRGIYFIERPGSVQSAVRFASLTVPFKDKEYLPIRVASNVINSSFAGRMFKIIREKHSYTYSPTGGLSSHRFYNYSIFGSDVRNAVTDSTIISIKDEILNDLIKNGPTASELETIKQFRIGQFYLGFESSGYLGVLIQQYDFKGVPLRMIQEYPNNYNKVTVDDVQKATKDYLSPEESYIIVVGDPSIKPDLEKLGQVFTYNTDYEKAAQLKEADIDANELIENYTEALGGKDAIDGVDIIEANGNMVMIAPNGQKLPGKTSTIMKRKSGKIYRSVDLNIYKSTQLCNGTKAWEISNNNTTPMTDEDVESLKLDADPFGYTTVLQKGYSLKVTGKKGNQIVAELKKADKLIQTLYFNSENYLLEKTEATQVTPRGNILVTVKYSNYKDVDGLKLPTQINTENPMFNMETSLNYTINTAQVDDSKFEPSPKK